MAEAADALAALKVALEKDGVVPRVFQSPSSIARFTKLAEVMGKDPSLCVDTVDETLMRFLVARDLDVGKAKQVQFSTVT
jgi:Xaa-Pro aminopeptidase